MDLIRLAALNDYWKHTPPAHISLNIMKRRVSAFIGYDEEAPAASGDPAQQSEVPPDHGEFALLRARYGFPD